MFDGDMSAYMGVFLHEAEEQLFIIENEVLELEQNGHEQEAMERIETIFRAAHTLKGSSGAMGFDPINKLTHQLENVFDLLRRRQLTVDAALVDVILQTVDHLKQMKETLASGSICQDAPETLLQALERFTSFHGDRDATDSEEPEKPDAVVGEVPTDPIDRLLRLDEYQVNIIKQALDAEQSVVAVYVRIVADAVMKSVRSLLIHNNLKELGEIIVSVPPIQDLEDEQAFDGTLVFVLVTSQTRQQMIHVVNQISEIDAVHLSFLTKENLHTWFPAEPSQLTSEQALVPAADASDVSSTRSRSQMNQTVRVDVERLEHLLNLVGEMIIDQTRLAQFRAKLEETFDDADLLDDLSDISSHLGRVVAELQEGMMKTRMFPIEQLFNRFPRMIRDLSQRSGKQVDLVMDGKETELDRTLIEEIGDPIIHLLRNCIDHGLETAEQRKHLGKPPAGKLVLKAEQEENRIVITIADDGKGIDIDKVRRKAIESGLLDAASVASLDDKEALQLIFKPGFSTAAQVTDLSGRGVGMDIVKSHIEKLNGMIDIRTSVGEGTVFTIKLPLTLAVNRSLLVQIGMRSYAIPLSNVLEIIRQTSDNVRITGNREVAIVRGNVLPLVRLHKAFGEEPQAEGMSDIVVVGLAEKRVALAVDRTLGNQEIVIKPLGSYIGSPKYIAGATVTGNGGLMLILDINTIIRDEGADLTDLADIEKKREEQSLEPYVTFRLGVEPFAAPIRYVQSIIEVPVITPLVHASDEWMGIIALRGQIIPVMDTHRRLGLVNSSARTASARIMIMDIGHRKAGMIVDQVNQVVRIDVDRIDPVKDGALQLQKQFVQGTYHRDNLLVTVLHASQILLSAEYDMELDLASYEESPAIEEATR